MQETEPFDSHTNLVIQDCASNPSATCACFYSSLHRIRPWWSFWCFHSGYRHKRGLRPQGPHENSHSTGGPQRHGPERDVIRQELRYDRRHVLMHRMRHRISTLPPCCLCLVGAVLLLCIIICLCLVAETLDSKYWLIIFTTDFPHA